MNSEIQVTVTVERSGKNSEFIAVSIPAWFFVGFYLIQFSELRFEMRIFKFGR